ncbi:MAG: HAD-IA family hydrolase [Hyphomicrobiaceae bacterium]|nr:HAD-IA family hydrolase [Hyphomicrobiaceae bacterium]
MNNESTEGRDQPKLVIFDCDGTLVDSQHVIIGAMKSAFENAGLVSPADHEIRGIIGLSLHEAVGALVPPMDQEQMDRQKMDEKQLDDLVEGYKAAFIEQRKSPDFHEPLFTGAREILQDLAAQPDILLGVATGKSRRGVDVLFEREGLGDFFFTIQTADDAPSKPHPGMIENAMQACGVRGQNVFMIGDTSYDMAMARNADVRAIGVGWGYHERHILHEAGAHHMIEKFSEISTLVAAGDRA